MRHIFMVTSRRVVVPLWYVLDERVEVHDVRDEAQVGGFDLCITLHHIKLHHCIIPGSQARSVERRDGGVSVVKMIALHCIALHCIALHCIALQARLDWELADAQLRFDSNRCDSFPFLSIPRYDTARWHDGTMA